MVTLEWVIKYWLTVLFGLIITGLTVGLKKLDKKIDEQESIKLGVQALLRDRLIQAYNINMNRGWCPIYERENIEEMARQYKNLGGNGIVTDLLRKLEMLPTEPPHHKG